MEDLIRKVVGIRIGDLREHQVVIANPQGRGQQIKFERIVWGRAGNRTFLDIGEAVHTGQDRPHRVAETAMGGGAAAPRPLRCMKAAQDLTRAAAVKSRRIGHIEFFEKRPVGMDDLAGFIENQKHLIAAFQCGLRKPVLANGLDLIQQQFPTGPFGGGKLCAQLPHHGRDHTDVDALCRTERWVFSGITRPGARFLCSASG